MPAAKNTGWPRKDTNFHEENTGELNCLRQRIQVGHRLTRINTDEYKDLTLMEYDMRSFPHPLLKERGAESPKIGTGDGVRL